MEAAFKRTIKPGLQYNNLFPVPDNQDSTLAVDGNVEDTVKFMGSYIQKYLGDTAKLAPKLKGSNLEQTLKNVWSFVYNHIQYKLDTPGQEQLRRPARSWMERKTGVDCDCYTIFISTILVNLGIDPIIRIVQIPPATSWHHVYPIVKSKGKTYVLDAVLDRFNYEKPFERKKDFTMNNLGIPIKGLHGIFDNTNDISDSELLGFGILSGDPETDLYNHLVKTREIVQNNPDAIALYDNPGRFIAELDMAIEAWNTPQRQEVLNKLAQAELKLDASHPLSGEELPEDVEQDDIAEITDLINNPDETSFDSVIDGPGLGAILAAKFRKLDQKKNRLVQRMPHIRNAGKRTRLNHRINLIKKAKGRIQLLNTLNPVSKNKLAQRLRARANEIREELVDKPIQQDYQNDFDDLEDDYRVSPASYIQEMPYDDWLEQMEDFIDDIEDAEDDVFVSEIDEIGGLGHPGLGAFWHKRKKRLEKKKKRQEKRLQKAKDKGKSKAIERLKIKIIKVNQKQEGGKEWRKIRKQWRKDNKRGFWNGAKKIGKGAIESVIKFNPVSIAARNGFLAATKVNFKKIASRLKWGYATKEQAIKGGISEQKWIDTKKALEKVKKLHITNLKGNEKTLRRAIMQGGKGLSGIGEINGDPITMGVIGAAATPIIIKVIKIMKDNGLFDEGDPAMNEKAIIDEITNGSYQDGGSLPRPDQLDNSENLPVSEGFSSIIKYSLIGLGLLGLGYAGYSLLKPKKQLGNSNQQPAASNQLSGPKKKSSQPKAETSKKVRSITLT